MLRPESSKYLLVITGVLCCIAMFAYQAHAQFKIDLVTCEDLKITKTHLLREDSVDREVNR